MATYDVFKRILLNKFKLNDNTLTHFAASTMAGFVGAVMTNPIDVVKTRYMSSSDNYKNSIDCFK